MIKNRLELGLRICPKTDKSYGDVDSNERPPLISFDCACRNITKVLGY